LFGRHFANIIEHYVSLGIKGSLMKKNFLALVIILASTAFAFSQTATPAPTPDAEKEKAQMVAFLRDVDQEVSNLRLPENRITFFAEVGSAMWQFDETQARTIYAKAINDLRQIIMSYSAAAADAKAAQAADPDALTASFVGIGYRDPMATMGRNLLQVRRQVLLSIAQNDAELALNALADTSGLVLEDGRYGDPNDDALMQELAVMAAPRSPKRALEMALESLKKEITSRHFRILQQLNEVDGEAARTLASAMVSKAKEGKTNSYVLAEFLKSADRSLEAANKKSAKPSPYTVDDARAIAGLFADKISENPNLYDKIDEIEKYLPARAMALKAKFAAQKRMVGNAVNAVRSYGMASNSNSGRRSAEEERWKKLSEDRKSLEVFSKLSGGKLPPEEREKVLAEARKTIARLRDPRDKVIALSAIATGVVSSDKPLALDLMREADRIAPIYPKNYADFMVVFAVASGYAMVDPEQAFPRIEALIASTNEIINAGMKIGEFIDVSGEMIQDNELKIGAFAGPMSAGLMSGMSIADMPIRKLADFDLDRTRALADRFERPEARVLAKLLILRAYAKKFDMNTATPDMDAVPETEPDEPK